MKRHMTSRFERNQVEYDGSGRRDKPFHASIGMADGSKIIQVKDGYDWLSTIKHARASGRAQ